MSFRPDLVDCWMFRVPMTARGVERPEILLIRRSPGRILPGLWQCVSGTLEPGERVAAGALRELAEETGFGPDEIEAFYDLDLVNQFHEPSYDAIVSAAVFAVRLRPGAEPRLSNGLPDGHRAHPRRPVGGGAGRLVRADARRTAHRVRTGVTQTDALVDSERRGSPTVRRHRRAT